MHRHRDERVAVPFTVGAIVPDDGPAVTAILTSRTDAELKIGDRMSAVIAPLRTDANGSQVMEL